MPANLLLQRLSANRADLTPKARVIADYILDNPRKVIFMTTKELSRATRVSEATVVRFVGQLGYGGYGDFLQELRDIIDTELTLIDRVGLTDMKASESERFRRVVYSEIDNLKQLHVQGRHELLALPGVDQAAVDPVELGGGHVHAEGLHGRVAVGQVEVAAVVEHQIEVQLPGEDRPQIESFFI